LTAYEKILHCLSQGVLEIDTNLVENMIRPTKLGMKNWMFFGSLEAGTNNALIYTLLANCRAQDLDPQDYLVEVIKRLPLSRITSKCTTCNHFKVHHFGWVFSAGLRGGWQGDFAVGVESWS
jgi:hypothetical protein